jgi:hypothetical protein
LDSGKAKITQKIEKKNKIFVFLEAGYYLAFGQKLPGTPRNSRRSENKDELL